ncbi:hypothetical protein P9314_15930 [Paenibacillus validus]|uniref:Uncharacterized protein n=1 Tax=Paenibacillus validus TaxID=44253 RepID=A0A7X3CUH8_9BACL|nr:MULTISPECIES: hypothetical protein [Paenibacillus]MED4602175.1 hypothetical protein [Paenibacillus validus]MED4609460.1 hypothetical protein [Paenibacillus validus]MUG73900.1 hypothetical protein [Paenibacillus validus]
MRTILTLALAAALLAGCQSQSAGDAADMKTMQKTVGRERLLQTIGQITPPSMDKSVMTQSDEQIIGWIKQIDDWTHQVLSSPVTGEMDKYAMEEMRTTLMQVYNREMADRMLAYFYRRDDRLGTYQANSTKAMLGLRSEWGKYELKKSQPDASKYRVSLSGANVQQDLAKSVMQHESEYLIEGDRLRITEFKTVS